MGFLSLLLVIFGEYLEVICMEEGTAVFNIVANAQDAGREYCGTPPTPPPCCITEGTACGAEEYPTCAAGASGRRFLGAAAAAEASVDVSDCCTALVESAAAATRSAQGPIRGDLGRL